MSLFALQILLAAGAVQGAFLAVLLFTRQTNRFANWLLGLLILLVSGQSVLVAFDTREFFLAFPHLSRVGWVIPTLFGPLLFLFTKRLTSQKPGWRWGDGLHFLPFAAYLLLLAPYFLQSAAAKRLYLDNFETASLDDFGLLNQITNGLHLGYALASLLLIRRHERNILQNFSELSGVRLRWLKQFLLLTLGIMAFSVGIFYARKYDLPLVSGLYHFHYLGAIFLIYWIGYKALAQPAIFQPRPGKQPKAEPGLAFVPVRPAQAPEPEMMPAAPAPEEEAPKYQKSGLREEEAEVYRQTVLAFMEEEQPYLRNNFAIQDLAKETAIPKHHLSRVINEKLGKNFFDFVNAYRVQEAQRLLLDPKLKHYTTLAIALQAGFNAKATFNAVFKKQTGLTPSEYLAQARQQPV
jgi:AraC-like DNA-binding protein